MILDRLLRQRNSLVLTKQKLYYYNTDFSLEITSRVQKVRNLKYTFTQKLATKCNFQIPSLFFSSIVTEWNAQDCGISTSAKDTSMLPSKCLKTEFGFGCALMTSCL